MIVSEEFGPFGIRYIRVLDCSGRSVSFWHRLRDAISIKLFHVMACDVIERFISIAQSSYILIQTDWDPSRGSKSKSYLLM